MDDQPFAEYVSALFTDLYAGWSDAPTPMKFIRSEFEYRLVYEALRRAQGNRARAAAMLNLNRTTLVEILRRMPPGPPSELQQARWALERRWRTRF